MTEKQLHNEWEQIAEQASGMRVPAAAQDSSRSPHLHHQLQQTPQVRTQKISEATTAYAVSVQSQGYTVQLGLEYLSLRVRGATVTRQIARLQNTRHLAVTRRKLLLLTSVLLLLCTVLGVVVRQRLGPAYATSSASVWDGLPREHI